MRGLRSIKSGIRTKSTAATDWLQPQRTTSSLLVWGVAAISLSACTRSKQPAGLQNPGQALASTQGDQSHFERDRASILSMAGSFEVVFDFRETVPLTPDYSLAPPKKTGATELVVVIEDKGTLIRLQHLLVVGGEMPMVIKHWRQDWRYQPQSALQFIGGNAWQSVPISAEQSRGAWSQTVYQVDDTPRYAAVGRWEYGDSITQWTPEAQWRPLPRRDMTTRSDYHALKAVNRHVLTPFGWAHEQDNTKIVLREPQHALVRDVGVNSYKRNNALDLQLAQDYWQNTRAYWQKIRDTWDQIEAEHPQFALNLKGETSALYMPLLALADKVAKNEMSPSQAALQGIELLRKHLVYDLPELSQRLRPAPPAQTTPQTSAQPGASDPAQTPTQPTTTSTPAQTTTR